MDVNINSKNPVLLAHRLSIILGAALALFFAISLVVFLFTEHWMRRVLFFPEVNSKKFEAEVRYLPKGDSETHDIRLLIEDLILGPSNFGYTNVLPAKTRLVSVILADKVLYVGFSKGAWQVENNLFDPRQMLQAVANSLYFNFPWLENIYFFIDGKEVTDLPLIHRADLKLDVAKMIIPLLNDLGATMRFTSHNPLFPSSVGKDDVFFFQGGARWDERLFK